MNRRKLLFLFLLLTIPLSPALADPLRAGAATVNITPPVGTLINGGVGPGIAKEIHDDLFARALVLTDGVTTLVLVTVDTCLVDRAVFDEAKKLAEEKTRIPARHMMMSATHTHSAGSICGAHLTEPDEPYRKTIPAKIAEAVRMAHANLAPAQIGWGSGSVPQHVFCRRVKLKPGSTYVNQLGQADQKAKMNWDSPHADDLEPAGPVDPEVSVLSVRHADGRPLALLANYSLHYVGDVGPGHISADYFGVFAERMAEMLNARKVDPPFVGMMSNGTSGDVNNNDFRAKRPPAPPYTRIRLVAEDVAQEAYRVQAKIKHQREVKLSAAYTELKLATRRPSAELIAQSKELLRDRPLNQLKGWKDNYARETLIIAAMREQVSIPMQVFRIGDLAVAGWPGEIFAASGLELKKRSPVRPLFNISLANGWYGYIPPPDQHALGAYETWLARTSFLEIDAIPKMTEAFLELLKTP